MIKKHAKKILIGISLVVLLLYTSSSLVMANLEMAAPTIDGLIGDLEWSGADVNDQFFIDANNSDGNIDGQNRLLVGEDEDNLYIGLDLNSDQTVDPNSEWVGIWLNTNNRTFDSLRDWSQYLNDGVESLIVNVSNEEIWDPWSDSGFQSTEYYYLEEEDVVIPTIYNDYSGDYTNINSFDSSYYTINSTLYTGYEVTRLDIEYNLSMFFGELIDEFSGHINGFNAFVHSEFNESISSHRVVAWKPDGTLDVDDPDQFFSGPTTGGSDTIMDGSFNAGNLTADNIFKLSFLANSSLGSFQVQYDEIRVKIQFDEPNFESYSINRPFSTIQQAEYAVGFGSSSLNATAHRQFEFKIPKSELEHYNSNEKLGIIVAGYGTLEFEDSNYWTYSHELDWICEEFSEFYIYYDMLGVETGDDISITSPNDITYEFGQTGHNITWSITDTYAFTPLYTVYQNDVVNRTESWTSGTPIIVDIDNLDPGVYNYTIIATDGYGGSIQDEVIVTVVNADTRGIPSFSTPFLVGITIFMIGFLSHRKKQIIIG